MLHIKAENDPRLLGKQYVLQLATFVDSKISRRMNVLHHFCNKEQLYAIMLELIKVLEDELGNELVLQIKKQLSKKITAPVSDTGTATKTL